MKSMLPAALLFLGATIAFAAEPVKSYEGVLTIPTYEHSARETEPPLFANSTVSGMYPFTTFLMPYKNGPKPKQYKAIFLENEYLKVTYIGEFGGRIYSVFDKLRNREMLYRNDVVKPAPYNPRNSWPQSGMELTGPHDLHTLTLYSEPYWASKVVHHEDGSVSLALGEVDPVYGMNVGLTATLHPGVAALEISVSCYNGRDSRMPQMFWVNTAIAATPQTRFIYPMSRTVGHTTADVADWPTYNGTDYSFDRNNLHMLGVFGIDIYDNFQGAYQFDRDYGIFRFADRRVVQGMKLWTFGYGEGAKSFEQGYTDAAGPYVELQSGRHVWDGHYEWVAPHTTERWSEWWIPVSKTGGLTTLTRDVALKLDVQSGPKAANFTVKIVLSAVRVAPGAKLVVKAQSGKLLESLIDLDPARPIQKEVTGIAENGAGLSHLTVSVTDAGGHVLLDYQRPDSDPGRKEYTPFTRPLEQPHKPTEQMSIEELTLAAEYRLKELDEAGARVLLNQALKRDSGYSQAHTLLGITEFKAGRYEQAIEQCNDAINRDPYADAAYYYLAMSQLAIGRGAEAERNLYFIWPESAHFGKREYQLGLISLKRGDRNEAKLHMKNAVTANGQDLLAHLTLALVQREDGNTAQGERELAAVEELDPTNRIVQAERWLANPDVANRDELLRLLGGQTQEALQTVVFYRNLQRWKEAARLLRVVDENKRDVWGTTPEFYYTLAYCERQAGDDAKADAALVAARASAGNVDRFPYREEAEAPLMEAVRLHPDDATARFDLACLLYFRGRPKEAIAEWENVTAINPRDFSSHRALGLAYAEQGLSVEKAATELERAIELNPAHVRTLDDLSSLYARTGRFNDQLTLLKRAQQRTPADDDLAAGILTAYLSMGRYDEAQQLLDTHQFSTRHRSYGLRDQYRVLRYGLGSQAFNRGDYSGALSFFQSAMLPPASLGIDTFQGQNSPRLDYYVGRTLEALGRSDEARQSYMRAISGVEQLTGDRDSWNSENFFMALALERLNRADEARNLEPHFTKFAETEKDSQNPTHRAEARYLLGLIARHGGNSEESKELFAGALEARPDLLAARLEMRGDTVPIASGRN
jgi:tetratricopeptide (TPR) repeat protein